MANPKRRAAKAKQRKSLKNIAERKRIVRSKYPSITIEAGTASNEFVLLVRQAVNSFSFDSLHVIWRAVFKIMKKSGVDAAIETFQTAAEHSGMDRNAAKLAFLFNLGSHLYQSIERDQLRRYLPFEDAEVRFYGQNIVVACRALSLRKHASGTIYFSPKRPTIRVGDEELIIGWSRHAIERLAERVVGDPLSYTGAGDVFGLIYNWDKVERITLPSGQEAFKLYYRCQPGFIQHTYAKALVNAGEHDASWSYVAGYCPTVICDGFIKAKTLLLPGYKDTPEDQLIQQSTLSWDEKLALRKQVENLTLEKIAESGDVSFMKWFHENGCPQVKRLAE